MSWSSLQVMWHSIHPNRDLIKQIFLKNLYTSVERWLSSRDISTKQANECNNNNKLQYTFAISNCQWHGKIQYTQSSVAFDWWRQTPLKSCHKAAILSSGLIWKPRIFSSMPFNLSFRVTLDWAAMGPREKKTRWVYLLSCHVIDSWTFQKCTVLSWVQSFACFVEIY